MYTKTYSTLRSFQERTGPHGTTACAPHRWLKITVLQDLGLSGSFAKWVVSGYCQGWKLLCPDAVSESPRSLCASQSSQSFRLQGSLLQSKAFYSPASLGGVPSFPAHRAWGLAAPRWHPGSLVPRQKTLFWTSKPVLWPFLLSSFNPVTVVLLGWVGSAFCRPWRGRHRQSVTGKVWTSHLWQNTDLNPGTKSKVSTLTSLSSYIRSLFTGHELWRVVVDEMTDTSIYLHIKLVPLLKVVKMKAWLNNNRVQFPNVYVKIADIAQ